MPMITLGSLMNNIGVSQWLEAGIRRSERWVGGPGELLASEHVKAVSGGGGKDLFSL